MFWSLVKLLHLDFDLYFGFHCLFIYLCLVKPECDLFGSYTMLCVLESKFTYSFCFAFRFDDYIFTDISVS